MVTPAALIGVPVLVPDPGGPMNDAIYKMSNALTTEPIFVKLILIMDGKSDGAVRRGGQQERQGEDPAL